MKVTVLHGGSVGALLKKLDELVAGFGDGLVVRASGKEITGEFMLNHFAGSELFADRKLIVLTNPDENFEVDKLPENEETQLILVYEKELGARAKVLKEKRVTDGKVFSFAAPQDKRIWSLLDMILAEDKKSVGLTTELLEEFGGQYLLTMFIFNLRRVAVPGSAPDFVRNKLLKVRTEWGLKKVVDRYHDCLETDRKIKTGFGVEKDVISLMVINWVS